MPLELITGPPGSGKSRLLLEAARELCTASRRVLWIGLPTQRNSVLARAVAEGGLIGFEFVTEQQFCYRLLSRARLLRPLRVGTERLALVGAALAEVRQEVPLPGEARLFSAAIAELKRYGLSPRDAASLAEGDPESSRLSTVYQAYEDLKGDAWDYDDYRTQALELAERDEADPGADAVFVAGYRELLPMTGRLYASLARHFDVRVALPELPPGPLAEADVLTGLEGPATPERHGFAAPNEIEEMRWVLRSIKQELASGADSSELALVAPAGQLAAFSALAEEYRVPLMPEVPQTLAATREGRTLLELISLQEFTSPSALLALPGLERLAALALDQRVSGGPALLRLAVKLDERDRAAAEEAAEQTAEQAASAENQAETAGPDTSKAAADSDGTAGFEERLRQWLDRLAGAEADHLEWAARLVELVVTEIMPQRTGTEAFDATAFRNQALGRAREAAQLGTGVSFRAWWAALLEDTQLPAKELSGVALLSPKLTSGRKYRKAWLSGAVEGAYLEPGSEDYFLPEELRQDPAAGTGLPRRFTGQEELVLQEILQLAGELTVTYAASSQAGKNVPQLQLLGQDSPPPLPGLPAGSEFELEQGSRPQLSHDLEPTLVQLPAAETQWLRRYGQCPHRAWGEHLLRRSGDLELTPLLEWQQLRLDLLRAGQLSADGLEELAGWHPWAADWLQEHQSLLLTLRFGLRLPQKRSPHSLIDASGRLDGTVVIYRFTGPDTVRDPAGATELLKKRIAERYLAHELLDRPRQPEQKVRLFVWPILAAPLEAGQPGGQDLNQRWIRSGLDSTLEKPLELYEHGSVAPLPGQQQCANCLVADFCRRGLHR